MSGLSGLGRPWNDGSMQATNLNPKRTPQRPAVFKSLAVLGVWWLLGLSGCAHQREAPPALPTPVRAALEKAGLDASTLAVAVLPLEPRAGDRPASALLHQADRPMQPASAMKVVTSAVALDRVGPNVRGYTELRTAAPIEQGRLRGDLVVRGGADLELGLPQLWALMLELREAGVRHIEGDIVLDRHLFKPARLDIGVPAFDESPEFPYNVIPDALQLAGNLQVLELVSDRSQVSARLRPELPGVQLDNRLTLHPAGTVACRDWSTAGWNTPSFEEQANGVVVVRLMGRFPPECTQRQALQLMERNRQAQAQLRWVWAELGGQWNGRVREAERGEFVHEASPVVASAAAVAAPPTTLPLASAATPAAAAPRPLSVPTRLLARREARPWGEWLRPLNKTSDNVATRILYLLVGLEEERRAAALPALQAQRAPERSTLEWAEASVRRWLTEHGIPTEGLVMDNGSGLSRSERITPRQLALVLRAAHAQMHASELMMSLPIAGVDGSLRARMTDTPARGRARLKPGTLRNAVALAGYVEDAQGRRWVMAAMVNHDEAPRRGRPVLDAVANWVAAGANSW
ncbi:MAG: D-alanyl-D-alanine carboxypeptidase [Betaproteobacteria bacterium]|nr:D-alanyl-D-alanine carboxypeptidase [Betaproteobacteria bacterium]NBT09539.1 D-alanyl-D-alanine carboxypeptidase [Betaproteobacteria bacterium]